MAEESYADKILAQDHKEGLREAYRQHSNTFRAWLVAYGIALPVFLASHDTIWNKFTHAPNARCIAYLFFGGIALQVVLSLIDKYADLFCLSVIMGWRKKDSTPAQFGVWWLKYDWPSIVADFASIAFFGWATYATLKVLVQ